MIPNEQKNILLCDDNAINRKVIIAMLNGLSYKIIETSSGHEALNCVFNDQMSIDLVLLDIGMKDCSGIDVCRAIRASEQDQQRSLPVIAYTAHAMVEERKLYLASGFDDVLIKPVMLENLFNILNRHLGNTSAPPNIHEAC